MRLGGSGGGATDVVGADEERYDDAPGRGRSDDGGGTKEGGSAAIDRLAGSSLYHRLMVAWREAAAP